VDIIALIIARGGSRRLPRKNVLDFCGHPLVGWTVTQALCSRQVDHVYLSTDDDEIAEIGERYGAEIIRRPDWPDANEVSANRVYRHAIEYLEPMHGMDYGMVQIFPTSPLRYPSDIDAGIEFFRMVGGQAHVVAASPRRETILYEKLVSGVCEAAVQDKRYRYMDGNSGLFNICNPRWYMWITELLGSDRDDVLDQMLQENRHPERIFSYIETEPWQAWEVDTQVEFDMCQLAMKQFILKGKGIEIYEKYRRA